MKTKFTKKYDDYQNYIITYMKIDFKKISMFSILILLVFCGCRGEFNQNFEIENTKNTNFFNSKVDAEIVEIVKKINDKTNFVSKISDKFGLPDWENANKSTGSYTSKDINETIIIPLKDENNIHLTSLLFIENASSDNPNVYTVTNHQLYQYLIDKRNKLSDKENLMMTFLHFDNQIFGRENYYNMPKDLFTKFLKSSKHKLGTMHLFGKRTSSPTAKDSTFCLIVENCNGLCNGPCDGCGVCTTSLCYNLGGGYDSGGGDFGEGGPYNGGTTPVGSGGGTTVINAPWYLNSGIDMSLYTNHVRKIYFSLGNFGMYLNQSQVDFLQERLDITSMFNNYFASAASLNEAKFAFWGINYFIQNPDVTVTEFKNWFIEGSLSINLMNEFIQDLNNPKIVKPTKKFKNHQRVNCIFNKAKNAPNFKQYLQNFDGRFSTAHLSFDLKPLANNDANAETSPPKAYWINIVLNSNNLNRPSLDIARTLMHEIIHAEMFRILLSLAPTSNGEINVTELTNMLNTHNYPGIYDYFRRYGLNNMQHQQMSAHYIGIMKNYLKQIDNTITDFQAESISWVGLQGTIAWNNLGTTAQNNILNNYTEWKNSATHSCP